MNNMFAEISADSLIIKVLTDNEAFKLLELIGGRCVYDKAFKKLQKKWLIILSTSHMRVR